VFNRDACQQSSAAAVFTEAERPHARIHFTRRGTTWLWGRAIAVMMGGRDTGNPWRTQNGNAAQVFSVFGRGGVHERNRRDQFLRQVMKSVDQ
jgi:hypothetical protein